MRAKQILGLKTTQITWLNQIRQVKTRLKLTKPKQTPPNKLLKVILHNKTAHIIQTFQKQIKLHNQSQIPLQTLQLHLINHPHQQASLWSLKALFRFKSNQISLQMFITWSQWIHCQTETKSFSISNLLLSTQRNNPPVTRYSSSWSLR